MTNNATTTRRPINFQVRFEKEFNQSEPIVNVQGAYQNDWSKGGKGERIITNDYLNEKLYYFYNNGGPIMDL
ncbi:Uncharacterized [Syntrophomonas zehnderi OL-4]|uniref:Uncharacterized n=1 Tax=Syntrophomonas zehnderi OL-4 TaxID=690567 RepID=A0A0E4C9J5_9FIRM|nr:hypothetical protein [Syntrophomonas zehnderi]CFY01099.1 Uncharacterized [Syntrophomonas zehnderi OL-4]